MLVRSLPAHARARQRSAFVFAIIVALALAGCATGQPERAVRERLVRSESQANRQLGVVGEPGRPGRTPT
jgi:uncharacterized lipoprotein YmbA